MKKNVNGYINQNKKLFVALLTVIVMMAVFAPLKSFILKWLIDAEDVKHAVMALGLGCCIIIFNFGFNILGNNLFSLIQTKSVEYVRKTIIENLVNKNSKLSGRSADYLSVLTNDLQIIRNDYYDAVYSILQYGALLISALIMYVVIDVSMLLFVIIAGISSVTIPRILDKKIERARKKYSVQMGDFTAESKELLGGFDVIRNFLAGNHFLNKYNRQTEMVQSIDYNLQRTLNYSSGLSSLVGNLLFFLVMLFGMILVFENKITLGYMVAATNLSNFVVAPCQMISVNLARIKSCKSIIEKLNSLINLKEMEDGNKKIEGEIREISFDHVNFDYSEDSEKKILKDVAMCIDQNNNKVAIVGKSGSGKSTIAKLLYGYHDNYAGYIRVNGCDVREIKREQLCKKIGYLSQNSYIFNDSVRNNITLYEEFSEEVLEEAVRKAELGELISELPDGLDTKIEENGTNLSGGQLQRIVLARMWIRNYDCVIADEITSSLDPALSDEIMRLLLNSGKMVLAITHDLQNDYMKEFSSIYELKDGALKKVALEEIRGSNE